MSALVKLSGRMGLLGIQGEIGDKSLPVWPSLDNYSIKTIAGQIIAVGGKNDGAVLEDGVVEANQHVLIYPAVTMKPSKYQTLVSYNADLLKHGIVSSPVVISPGNDDIFIAFKASRKTNIKDFVHIFEFYMLD